MTQEKIARLQVLMDKLLTKNDVELGNIISQDKKNELILSVVIFVLEQALKYVRSIDR